MAASVWLKVRRDLGHQPIVAGRISGSTPIFIERYVYQAIDRTVSALGCTGLVIQFGGGRVREGEPDNWRSMNLPSQALLIPKGIPTHWHYSGTVDFAVVYFLEGGGSAMQSLEYLAQSRDAPLTFSDALVGAAAQQLLGELQKGPGADEGFQERLAGVMLEQVFRTLTSPGSLGINPRHVHFSRLQAVLNFVHDNPAGNLSVSRLASLADVSQAHFCRIFRDAMGVPPHRYVLSTRLEVARKLLAHSGLPISRIAEESGFSSQSHLTASFRSAHSTTPAEYRADRTSSAPRTRPATDKRD
ncbi:MAG: AraC family transcriptional regulator [Steroidobacteraceae bacterium]|nr:AraC family transcriptional regulator [Steroidobacteraceae bacterium]